MSLLFQNAIDAFDVGEARLLEPSEVLLETARETPLPSRTIVTQASHRETLRSPETDERICIPVHEPDSAVLTGEYLVYRDHDVFGEIFIYDAGEREDYVDRETFERTGLADRIRFWHSDYVPDETPSYYTSPIDSPEHPTRDVDAEAFFDELEAHVDLEHSTQRAETREEIAGRSARDLFEEGFDAIPDLRGEGRPSGGIYRFRLTDDLIDEIATQRDGDRWTIEREFGIYEGNDVLLSPPNPERAPDAFPLVAEVDRISGRTVDLAIDWSELTERSSVGRFLGRKRVGYGLALLVNDLPFEREREAIETIRSSGIGEVLTGQRPLTFGGSFAANSTWMDTQLNQEQRVAVRHALLADDLFCIHGPPGTGKTRTLVEIVRRAVQADARVLVCADSNQAVDNLVVGSSTPETLDESSLHAFSQHGTEEFTLTRHNSRRSSRAFVREAYGSGSPSSAGSADVVASTNGSGATLSPGFDLVVMDEATQATCATSCIPLSKGTRVVLAGDHRQLPPYSSTETPPTSAHGASLFEHLYADGGVYDGVGVQLRTQYRMHRDIASFPNREFYHRQLRNGRDISPLGDRDAFCGYDVGGCERIHGHGYSRSNTTEARLVTHLVDGLLEDGLAPEEIGVITPYLAQVDEISRVLATNVDDPRAITVDTIDSFQGSEKTAIVISLVRSNGEGDVGFLGRPDDGPRRLNVALTRAKRYCAVVANWRTLTKAQGSGGNGTGDGSGDGSDGTTDTDSCTDLYVDLESMLADTGRMRRVEPEFIPV